jgi:hypothetical protein
MKEPMSKLMGIGDRTLKSLRMVGEHISHTPVFRSKLRGIKPKVLRPNKIFVMLNCCANVAAA